MQLTDSRFIEELILCMRSDEAVSISFSEHPDIWSGKDYAGRQEMRFAIARAVRAGHKKDNKKGTDILRNKVIE